MITGRGLDDLVQPADGGAVAGVAERLELGVPGGAQDLVELLDQGAQSGRVLRRGDRRADPVLRYEEVAVDPGGPDAPGPGPW